MSLRDRGGVAVEGGRFAAFVSWFRHPLTWNDAPPQPDRQVDTDDAAAGRQSAAEASADMGWLSLCEDAGGHSIHEGEVTFLGVTPDDIDSHDADGGDLSWISLGP